MSRLMGWVSPSLLEWISQTLGFHGARALWWHRHGAHALDYLLISFGGLLLAVLGWTVWRMRARLVGRDSLVAQARLWGVLLALVFGGSALLFTLEILPDRMADDRRLAPIVAGLHGPIYTDVPTAHALSFLFDYRSPSIRSTVLLDDPTVNALLAKRRGCLVVNEPELDYLMNSIGRGLGSTDVYGLLERPPAGWFLTSRFRSATNPLEYVEVVCARP